uniref:Uncharacterized protein n=1 Tax=Medicago truncatula TaxID=3880 RepID=Q2HVQ1_MEDTR|nr:hypothetical protein MtrDRAFT_AC148815g13v2 [Medicago truncatula]
MKQKATKKNSKAKTAETANNVFTAMQDTLMERTSILAELGSFKYLENKLKVVENNDIELNFKELKIPFKGTFEMIQRQRGDH